MYLKHLRHPKQLHGRAMIAAVVEAWVAKIDQER